MFYLHSTNQSFPRRAIHQSARLFSNFSDRIYSLERTTASEDIRNFFKKLRPVNTGYDLIRFGNADGGYLLPDDLVGIETCISPGFGGVMSFESDLSKVGIRSFVLDKEIADQQAEGIFFLPYYLAPYDEQNLGLVSMDSLIEQLSLGGEPDLLGQIDIENDEWKVLESIQVKTLSRFRILVIELHSLSLLRVPFVYHRIFSSVIDKLLRVFHVAHFHTNNIVGSWTLEGKNWFPETIELTLHRKDRCKGDLKFTKLPNALDQLNSSRHPDFDIAKMFQNLGE